MDSRSLARISLFAFALFAGLSTLAERAAASGRISTGRDLSLACTVAQAYYLDPQGPMPRQARYCKQYIEGYLMVQKRIAEDDFPGNAPTEAGGATSSKARACIPTTMSYGQMATLIVHTGEWHPALLDGPAIDLINKAFADRSGC